MALFRRRFRARLDVYSVHEPASGRTWMEKGTPGPGVLEAHFRGERLIGFYPLLPNGTATVGVLDVDTPDANEVVACRDAAIAHGFHPTIERSKSKGYHAWFFFEQPVPGAAVRSLMTAIRDDAGVRNTEIFPKQDRLRPGGYGNAINLPLYGIASGRPRTTFMDAWMCPVEDPWDELAKAPGITARDLDDWSELNPDYRLAVARGASPSGASARTYGLVPCVQAMLEEGVETHQRVACFRIGVALRKAGLPKDLATVVLEAWARRNRPTDGRQRLTVDEIAAQTASAYAGSGYAGCGCSDEPVRRFCDSECPVYRIRGDAG